jgi:hypothetical protein
MDVASTRQVALVVRELQSNLSFGSLAMLSVFKERRAPEHVASNSLLPGLLNAAFQAMPKVSELSLHDFLPMPLPDVPHQWCCNG